MFILRDHLPQLAKRHIKDVLKMSYEDTQDVKMSFRRLKDAGFANLEDVLHSYLKDISYSGI